MKRIFTLIVALIYFTVSSGMVVSVHYCMGKIVNATNPATTKKCCCKKPMKGCCKTEQKLVKLQDTHKAATAFYNFSTAIVYLNNPFVINHAVQISSNNKTAYNNNSPPISPQDICLLNCVFRI